MVWAAMYAEHRIVHNLVGANHIPDIMLASIQGGGLTEHMENMAMEIQTVKASLMVGESQFKVDYIARV